jgi:hypothetical protein
MAASTAFGNQETPKKPVRQRLYSHFRIYTPVFDSQSSTPEIPARLLKKLL